MLYICCCKNRKRIILIYFSIKMFSIWGEKDKKCICFASIAKTDFWLIQKIKYFLENTRQLLLACLVWHFALFHATCNSGNPLVLIRTRCLSTKLSWFILYLELSSTIVVFLQGAKFSKIMFVESSSIGLFCVNFYVVQIFPKAGHRDLLSVQM